MEFPHKDAGELVLPVPGLLSVYSSQSHITGTGLVHVLNWLSTFLSTIHSFIQQFAYSFIYSIFIHQYLSTSASGAVIDSGINKSSTNQNSFSKRSSLALSKQSHEF